MVGKGAWKELREGTGVRRGAGGVGICRRRTARAKVLRLMRGAGLEERVWAPGECVQMEGSKTGVGGA